MNLSHSSLKLLREKSQTSWIKASNWIDAGTQRVEVASTKLMKVMGLCEKKMDGSVTFSMPETSVIWNNQPSFAASNCSIVFQFIQQSAQIGRGDRN
jgi:hypothetical protein